MITKQVKHYPFEKNKLAGTVTSYLDLMPKMSSINLLDTQTLHQHIS